MENHHELLTRGIDEIIDKKNLEKKLKKKLRIKLGVDPTSPNLHLGRSIPLLKLSDFQALGHKIVFIVGDFTGVIGDTSDKEAERPMLTEKEVKKNMSTYSEQVGKIIDMKKCEFHYNSKWLKKLSYKDIAQQANIFSLNEFIARENIKKRVEKGKRVSLRELLYPLMQGYDSVEVKADVEVGGTDQRFNLLAGRTMQRYYNQEPQDIITNPLIEGIDGRKMSSSWGNTINLLDSPNEMYGKIMSLKDELITKYFELMTRVDLKTIAEYKKLGPRDYKAKLAFEIVKMYHSTLEAINAEKYFTKTFTKKETPEEIKTIKPSSYQLIDILIESRLCSSKGEARRVIEQRGIKINKEIINRDKEIKKGDIVQKGKRYFIKVI